MRRWSQREGALHELEDGCKTERARRGRARSPPCGSQRLIRVHDAGGLSWHPASGTETKHCGFSRVRRRSVATPARHGAWVGGVGGPAAVGSLRWSHDRAAPHAGGGPNLRQSVPRRGRTRVCRSDPRVGRNEHGWCVCGGVTGLWGVDCVYLSLRARVRKEIQRCWYAVVSGCGKPSFAASLTTPIARWCPVLYDSSFVASRSISSVAAFCSGSTSAILKPKMAAKLLSSEPTKSMASRRRSCVRASCQST